MGQARPPGRRGTRDCWHGIPRRSQGVRIQGWRSSGCWCASLLVFRLQCVLFLHQCQEILTYEFPGNCNNDNENYCHKMVDTYNAKYPNGDRVRVLFIVHLQALICPVIRLLLSNHAGERWLFYSHTRPRALRLPHPGPASIRYRSPNALRWPDDLFAAREKRLWAWKESRRCRYRRLGSFRHHVVCRILLCCNHMGANSHL